MSVQDVMVDSVQKALRDLGEKIIQELDNEQARETVSRMTASEIEGYEGYRLRDEYSPRE